MSKFFTRRKFLRSGMALVVGYGLRVPGWRWRQTPDSTPQVGVAGVFEVDGKVRQVHDPAIIKAEDAYYIFSTGPGISIRKSVDLVNWDTTSPSRVFTRSPAWAREAIPGSGDIWAPDVAYFNGKYHLYYSVSTFGSNRSLIALATNTTLNSEDEAYEWVDQGMVIESNRTDNYNCIDPNPVLDTDGVPWLAFGSFWSGIKMRRLEAATGKLSDEDTTLYSLAGRQINSGAIEAPYIIRKGDFYYLFASFDFCCRGKDSTYHVRVGRSENIIGPYLDRDGLDMLQGGGTQVTFPTERWRGPGHNSILQEADADYIVYHSYDFEIMDAPTLRIDPLTWDADGWPSVNTAT
jgi:arabinan endo-1,5-alpha-L-arabinosidase